MSVDFWVYDRINKQHVIRLFNLANANSGALLRELNLEAYASDPEPIHGGSAPIGVVLQQIDNWHPKNLADTTTNVYVAGRCDTLRELLLPFADNATYEMSWG